MTPDEITKLLEGMSFIVEATTGFKNKLEEAGFSSVIAEEAALEFIKMILRQTPQN